MTRPAAMREPDGLDRGSPGSETRHYRTIWVSDIHLGTRGCKAAFLLDFLKHTESDYLYLVGDIVDGWRLRSSWYWNQLHNDVIQKLLRKARKGTNVVYVPGNHDEMLRDYLDLHFGGIHVVGEAMHRTADGRRLLFLHGGARYVNTSGRGFPSPTNAGACYTSGVNPQTDTIA